MKKIIKLTKRDLNEMVLKTVNSILHKNSKIHEVKYFHPSGKPIPNGSHYQKGGFLLECRQNTNSFVLSEGVHGEQYGMSKYRGGIIVFSTDVNAVELSSNKFINKLKQFIETIRQRFNKSKYVHSAINDFNQENEEYIGAYSLGNFFQGKYVGDNGEMFNDKSLCLEINGLSSKSLHRLGEIIAEKFRQETVLIKDLNKNKIYLADGIPSDNSIDDDLENVNIDC